MFFVHRVHVPGTSSLLQPRRRAATVDAPPSVSTTHVPVVVVVETTAQAPTDTPIPPVAKTTTRRPSPTRLEKPPSHTPRRLSLDVSPYLHEDDEPDDETNHSPDRTSAFTGTSSWDSSPSDATAGDLEIFCARDSYSAECRLSDLVKLEQILVPPPRIRARTMSWSPQATLAETTSSVASNILRRRLTDLSSSEQQLVGVLDDFMDCMKRIYDDRCLKVTPRRRVEADLEGMLHAIETVRRQSDASTLEAADEMVRMIHHVMEDVHGLHHFGQKGEVEYVKL